MRDRIIEISGNRIVRNAVRVHPEDPRYDVEVVALHLTQWRKVRAALRRLRAGGFVNVRCERTSRAAAIFNL